MDHIFHPIAAKEAREIEAGYSRILGELADRFWSELNEAIDEVFTHPPCHRSPFPFHFPT